MKKTLIIISAIGILIFAGTQTFAQQFSLVPHVGITFPTGDFANDDINKMNTSGAAVGFAIGGEALYHINHFFSIIATADFCMNTLKGSYKDDLEKGPIKQLVQGSTNYDMKWQKYFNIPIMVGAEVNAKINTFLAFFGNAMLGPDFKITTNSELELGQSHLTDKVKPSTQLGFKFGGGLLIKEKYRIGFSYAGLGQHRERVERTIENPGQPSQISNITIKPKVSMLMLTFGYTIKL